MTLYAEKMIRILGQILSKRGVDRIIYARSAWIDDNARTATRHIYSTRTHESRTNTPRVTLRKTYI